jgi:putative peptidoglycan lipid II flippase
LIGSAARVALAAAALAGVAWLVWELLDEALGRDLWAQIASMTAALGAGSAVYVAGVFALRVPEAEQIRRLLRRGGGSGRSERSPDR